MNGGLPERLDPREAARAGSGYAGALDPAALTRLATLVGGFDGAVEVRIGCAVDADGWAVVNVRANARVRTQCQRCLEPMVLDLAAAGVLGVVADEADAARLPHHYEPLELAIGEAVTVVQLAEDELLLALPAHPRHAALHCARGAQVGSPRPPGPFAELKLLMPGARRAGPDKE